MSINNIYKASLTSPISIPVGTELVFKVKAAHL